MQLRSLAINTSLALIPVILAYSTLWVSKLPRRLCRNVAIGALALLWLAFLPNTCYLLTEWRHFLEDMDAYNLFLRSRGDSHLLTRLFQMTVFYFAYSAFGMLAFTFAIRPMEHLAAKRGATVWFWGVPFFVALSLGVYLGLVLRFNSWNLVNRPDEIWAAIVQVGARPKLAIFIVMFGLFLWAAYESLDIWIDALTERWSRLSGRRIHLGPKTS